MKILETETVLTSGASTRESQASGRRTVELFAYLQLLDVLTTWIGFRLGLGEASPFIRMMVEWGPAAGLLLSKGLAFGIAILCIVLKGVHLIRWINYWFGALVVWNLFASLRVLNG